VKRADGETAAPFAGDENSFGTRNRLRQALDGRMIDQAQRPLVLRKANLAPRFAIDDRVHVRERSAPLTALERTCRALVMSAAHRM
jgi:hypothetical protein